MTKKMSEKEGKFKKRIFSVLESEYQPIIDTETYKKSFTTQLKSIAEIVSEAKKEFEELISGTWSLDEEGFHPNIYAKDSWVNPSEAIKWFRKWFGAP